MPKWKALLWSNLNSTYSKGVFRVKLKSCVIHEGLQLVCIFYYDCSRDSDASFKIVEWSGFVDSVYLCTFLLVPTVPMCWSSMDKGIGPTPHFDDDLSEEDRYLSQQMWG